MGIQNKHLVFVSLEPWDEVWRRNQFVCRELAARGWEILFVEPAADWSAGLLRRDWSQFARRPVWSPDGIARIRVARPVKVLPKRLDWGESVNRGLWNACVNRQLRLLGWERPHLWVNNQLLWPTADGCHRSRWGRVIYDITDDWSAATGAEAWLTQVRRDDEAMARLADAVIVCSQSLYDGKKECFGAKLYLVPNGVDLDHFRRVDSLPLASEMERDSGVDLVLGYSGTAHPDRLDVDLVATVAKARPSWSWVFIGPSHLSGYHAKKLDLPNIHFLGPRPYVDLPGYLAGIDVCVTPHRVTAFTESLNPIKLWEYLAVGHPIVSTPVAGFRDFTEHVELASGAEQWVQVIESIAKRLDKEKRIACDRRRDVVRRQGWSSRCDDVESILLDDGLTDRAEVTS